MGLLRKVGSEVEFYLPGRCLVGRSSACDLVLRERNVSGHHAAIEWLGGRWYLQDLGSRNGTFVQASRVEPKTPVALRMGERIRFGRDSPNWELVDVGEPRAMVRSLITGHTHLAEGGYLVLPEPEAPECSIFQAAQGWVIERDGEQSPIEDRATLVTAEGGLWRVFLPEGLPSTAQDSDSEVLVARLRLRFRVSRDEEQVELTGYFGDQRLDLQIRAHHYSLLLLARRRLADQAGGVPEPEQGWMSLDDLLRMLRVSEPHFNIAVHRARTQLSRMGVRDAASLVERQPRTRRLRIGVSRLEVRSLDS